MSAIIDTLIDENDNTIYPQTKTNAVLDTNGNNVDELFTSLNTLINNKVDKTNENTKVYGTHTDGTQTTIPYSSNGTAWTLAHRNSQGGLNAYGYQCCNTRKYSQCFFNHSGDMRYFRIGSLKASWSNNIFAGRIYTHEGYGSDGNQEIVDFNITIQNNQDMHGYAISTFNYHTGQELIMYFVKTNDWEWDVILKMHSWSSAIFEISISCPSSTLTDFMFTFDSNPEHVVESPSNSQLTITPTYASLTYLYGGNPGTGTYSLSADIKNYKYILVCWQGNNGYYDSKLVPVSWILGYSITNQDKLYMNTSGSATSRWAAVRFPSSYQFTIDGQERQAYIYLCGIR